MDMTRTSPATLRRQPAVLALSLAATILLCCTVLPLLIPHSGAFTFATVLEVLLWQGMGMVGWPLALAGVALSLPFGAKSTAITPALLILLYPAMQALLIRSVFARSWHGLTLVALHLLVMISFVIMWTRVLHGVTFIGG